MPPLPDRTESGESQLRRQAVGFLPGWDNREEQGALAALLDIAGHYHDLVNAAHEDAKVKAQMVALDAMGTSLRESSPASTVVVFTAAESSGRVSRKVGKGTLVAADTDGKTIPFETEDEIELITASLDQVIEVRDGKLMDLNCQSPDNCIQVVHAVFIRLNYAVYASARVEIDLTYTQTVPPPATWKWQLWTSEPGEWTDLEVNETIVEEPRKLICLKLTNATLKRSVTQVLDGHDGHWIRMVDAASDDQQRPSGSTVTVERVCVVTNLQRDASIPLEFIFVNQQKADPTTAIAPFGEAPRPGAIIAMACGDVFGRPAESISLHFERVIDGANASDIADNETPKAAKIVRKASALTKVGLNPFALLAALHELAREAVPFYAFFCRVLYELFELGLEKSRSVLQSLLKQATRLRRWLSVSDQVLWQSQSAPRTQQVSSEKNNHAQSPLTVGPRTVLELWNGAAWSEVVTSQDVPALTLDGTSGQSVTFSLKEGGAKLYQLYGQVPAHWLRIRLVSGVFGDWLTIHQSAIEGKGNARFLLSKPPRITAPLIAFEHTDIYRPNSISDTRGSAFAVTEYRWATPGLNSDTAKEFIAERYSCHLSPTLERLELPDGHYLGFGGPLPNGWLGIFAKTNQGDTENGIRTGDRAPITVECATAPDIANNTQAAVPPRVKTPEQVPQFGSAPKFLPCENIKDWNFGASLGTLLRLELSEKVIAPAVHVRVVARDRLQANSLYSAAGDPMLPNLDLYAAGTECILRDEEGAVKVKIERRNMHEIRLAGELSRTFGPATLELMPPELFGVRRSWLRFRNLPSCVERFEANAIRVTQGETHRNEVLGNSNGESSQAFRPRFLPVLEGECLEVLELEGKRAEIEYDLLREEVQTANPDNDNWDKLIRVDQNQVTGRIEKVWVQWQRQSSLMQSNSQHRHYVIDQQRGLILFGDGNRGRVPPISSEIALRSYRHGGGRQGNVGPNTIQQVLSPGLSDVPVNNPIRSEGGNDADTLEESWYKDEVDRTKIGPSRIERFLRQNSLFRGGNPAAVDAADYETIARRSSSAIADAIMLPPSKPKPGEPIRCTLIILPFDYRSMIPEPPTAPKRESPRQQVQLPTVVLSRVMESIGQSASPWVVDRLEIRGPEIVRLNIKIKIKIKIQEVLSSSESSTLRKEIEEWMKKEYFDAVSGGPSAEGWLSKKKQDILVHESVLTHRLQQLDRRIENYSIQIDQDSYVAEGVTKPKKIELNEGQIPLLAKLEIEPTAHIGRPSSFNNGEVRQA
jgi:hypothetical protein